MIKQLVVIVLLALFALSDGTSAPSISYIMRQDSVLVATSDSNYALSDPELLKQGWKTVTVIGANVTIYNSSNCAECIMKPLASMNSAEQSLIRDAKRRVNGDQNGFQGGTIVNPYGYPTIVNEPRYDIPDHGHVINNVHRVEYRGNGVMTDLGNSVEEASANSQQQQQRPASLRSVSIQSYGQGSFSISKEGLPNDIATIYLNNDDIVTFVYKDGRVAMKPVACMEQEERQLMRELRSEYEI